jgi:hypothetical protein
MKEVACSKLFFCQIVLLVFFLLNVLGNALLLTGYSSAPANFSKKKDLFEGHMVRLTLCFISSYWFTM